MAHKKAGGSSRNGRDSAGQRYGVKNLPASEFGEETYWYDRGGLRYIPE